MQRISSLIRRDREFTALTLAMAKSYADSELLPIAVNGLTGGARIACLVEAVAESLTLPGRGKNAPPALILTGNDEERAEIAEALSMRGLVTVVYKSRDLIFSDISASHDTDRERLSALHGMLTGEVDCIVACAESVLGYTMPKSILESCSVSLRVGLEIAPLELCGRLLRLGFCSVDAVESRGQFSHRGGILDFWGGESDMPTRVEFFGDEVDRMVFFDPINQRSVSSCDSVSLLPAREVIIDSDAAKRMLGTVDKLLENPSLTDKVRSKLLSERANIESGLGAQFRDKYLGDIYPERESFLDYYGTGGRGVVFLLGTSACRDNAKTWYERIDSERSGMISYGAISQSAATYAASPEDMERFLDNHLTVHINAFAGGLGAMRLSGLFGFRCRRCVSYGGNPRMLLEDLAGFRKGGYRVLLLSENQSGAHSLISTLADEGIGCVDATDAEELKLTDYPEGTVMVAVGNAEGFDLIQPRIAVLSMAEDRGRAIIENRKRQRKLRRIGGSAQRLMSYNDLSVGDYVVHVNYGIGLFEGIQAVTTEGVTRDYITIKYAGTDKLFVPADRLEMIGKYIGERSGDGSVKLSKMGGGDWTRAKSRARAAADSIAKELLQLYAERQRQSGFAFPSDSDMENSFCSEFEYEETDSQLIAIDQIKKDMMKPVPMNRLLCGDVGFGKTEVALRAAFKAVVGGKQVAILVPTTILALQDYQTALSRMRGYAVNIEMLSRFKKPKERTEILSRLRRGDIDIIIGTHAILSKELSFKDLGLLIIDEEQRFGVTQKEKLRQMAKNVDTLLLSATPIPRTLNMAMSGINDISVLDEAPGERRPVQTYVMEHDEEVIYDAIRRELDRGGQVLYVCNRIELLDLIAGRMMENIPKARVAYAHGRMDKEDLEDIWGELVRGELDVLVCTTIIETGVDLPNANTLIIEDADRFGLSQLHQIRGRVGRSERQAYAYFTYRAGKALSEVAEERLDAIREFAEFGAGFKIALRDMEIRGAGNLLGREQHGYIESVGYDLYIKLLNEAILEVKGETREKKFESTVVAAVSAHIPESYVSSGACRMEMYKKISLIECAEDADDVLDEFIDRFGEPPAPTERLINVALTKALAERAKISKVELTPGRIVFTNTVLELGIWAEIFAKYPFLGFAGAGSTAVVARLHRGADGIAVACEILRSYDKLAKEEKRERKGTDDEE